MRTKVSPGVISLHITIPVFCATKTAGMLVSAWSRGRDMMMSASLTSSYTIAATAPACSACRTCRAAQAPRRVTPGAAAASAAVRPRAPLGGALRTAQRRQPGAARQRLTTASLHLHDPLAAQAVLALVGAAVQGKRLLPL